MAPNAVTGPYKGQRRRQTRRRSHVEMGAETAGKLTVVGEADSEAHEAGGCDRIVFRGALERGR